MTMLSCIGLAGCVVMCHLLALRSNNVRHPSRWLAFVALVWLAVQAWPTYHHDERYSAKKLSPIEAGVLQLIANKQRDTNGETQNKAEDNQVAEHRNAGG